MSYTLYRGENLNSAVVVAENIKNKLQTMINGLDLNSLNTLFDQIGDVFAKENAETMEMLGELKDFKDIIKKD